MDKCIAREFVCSIADDLRLPSFMCETIEDKLIAGKAEEVIEYYVKRKRELKKGEV